MILNYCRGFRCLLFSTEKNNMKLVTEYESVTQKVLLDIESILQNAKQLQHARLLFFCFRFENYRPRKP
jgi:hypothetical protein